MDLVSKACLQMNALKKKKSAKELMNIGTFNIHVVHNAFMKGHHKFGEESSKFVVILRHFFFGWPARCKAF